MKRHLSETLNLPGPFTHWDDTKIALASPLGSVALDDSTRFYNPLWCAFGLGGIGNEGFDCTSWGHLPSCLAI